MNQHKVCIMGIGGGGSKIIDRISALSTDGPVLVVVNTDTRALEYASSSRKVRIGQIRTGGSGTGGNVELGRLSAEDDIDKIKPYLENAELLILVVTLGGGTGTGAAQVVLEQAKRSGCHILCFVTTPFVFEGETRIDCAQKALPGLCEISDAVISIPNDLLFESTGRNNMSQAFIKADETVGTAIRSVWKLITHPGYINLDFADLIHTVRGAGGVCSLAYGTGKGHNKAQNAIKELLDSCLTKRGELLAAARVAMISIVGGEDLALKEVGDIMGKLNAIFSKGSHISMGTVIDGAWRNKIMITIIFSDSWSSEAAVKEEKEVQKEKNESLLSPPPRKTSGGGMPVKRQEAQNSLRLESIANKRFAGTNSTILYGEDMDTPAYKRRGIKVPE